jgi:hypothetical protein
MLEDIGQYIVIFLSSMLKFIGGPLLGKLYGLSIIETAIFTSLGMMASVYIFSSFFGNKIHDWILKTFYKDRKLFSKKNRRTVKIWRAYGLKGIAFLTPILLTPIGGTIVAASFGESRKRIFKYMLLSAVFWACIFSFLVISFDFHAALIGIRGK